MITLDTSGLLALANARDPAHQACVTAMLRERDPYLVPAAILGETAYMLETRLGHAAVLSFAEHLRDGAFVLDCGERDLARIAALVDRYASLPLGFADAGVIACAERSGGRVLTLDRRDFDVVAAQTAITPVP